MWYLNLVSETRRVQVQMHSNASFLREGKDQLCNNIAGIRL